MSLVYDRLHKHLLKQRVLQVDETVCQVTKDGREGVHQSRMFVYRTSEMVKENPVILYKYEKTRSSKLAAAFLEGFSGILESDAFSGYKTLDHAENDIQAAFCWLMQDEILPMR